MVLLGVGLGSGALVDTQWANAYDISAGALVVESLSPLGTFGNFCAVILSLGLIANNIPGTYSAALGFQLLGRWFRLVPRWFWVIVSVIIYTICACVGRNHLFDIFEDFLALMGYWTIMWTTMTLEEQLIFRRKTGYNWDDWNKPSRLPLGIAACIAFCIGWVGAVLCMWQVCNTNRLFSTFTRLPINRYTLQDQSRNWSEMESILDFPSRQRGQECSIRPCDISN